MERADWATRFRAALSAYAPAAAQLAAAFTAIAAPLVFLAPSRTADSSVGESEAGADDWKALIEKTLVSDAVDAPMSFEINAAEAETFANATVVAANDGAPRMTDPLTEWSPSDWASTCAAPAAVDDPICVDFAEDVVAAIVGTPAQGDGLETGSIVASADADGIATGSIGSDGFGRLDPRYAPSWGGGSEKDAPDLEAIEIPGLSPFEEAVGPFSGIAGVTSPSAPETDADITTLLQDWEDQWLEALLADTEFETASVEERAAIYGGAGDDTLTGTAADETLYGLGGDDRLISGGGDDILVGGDGADAFVFSGADDSDVVISDFTDGVDVIELAGVAGFGDLTITQSGADAFITVNALSLELSGVTIATLDAGDFHFV